VAHRFRRARTRRWLIAIQLAATQVLVIAAGLCVKAHFSGTVAQSCLTIALGQKINRSALPWSYTRYLSFQNHQDGRKRSRASSRVW
jgi:hypothetical protein